MDLVMDEGTILKCSVIVAIVIHIHASTFGSNNLQFKALFKRYVQ
jgi:hypothetical protein